MVEDAQAEVEKRNLIMERQSLIRKQKFKEILTGDHRSKDKEVPVFDFIDQKPLALENSENGAKQDNEKKQNNYLKRKYLSLPNKSGIALIEFETEEDRDKESVKLVLVKYNSLFTYMFDKYSSKNFKNKPGA